METKNHKIDLFRIYFTCIIVLGHIIELWVKPALGENTSVLGLLNTFNGTYYYVTDCFLSFLVSLCLILLKKII